MENSECQSGSHHWDAIMCANTGVHYCGDCGAHLDDLQGVCPDNEHESGANYCIRCGDPVGEPQVVSSAEPEGIPFADDADVLMEVEALPDDGDDEETRNPIERLNLRDVLKQVG